MTRERGWIRPRRLVVSGPESTGKTTLARDLAIHADTVWVEEYARTYSQSRGTVLAAIDVEPMARGQIDMEDRLLPSARGGLIVLDTDLISTCVYSRVYHGTCPHWIEEMAVRRLADLYLLCNVDVEWVPDPPARDAPGDRAAMLAAFEEMLRTSGAAYVTIGGDWETRFERAAAALGALMGRKAGSVIS